MDSLGRLLLRFLLVPLGYLAAVVVATLVIVLGSWKLAAAAADPDTQVFAVFGFAFAAPVLLVSAWIGWSLFGYLGDSDVPLNQPLPVIAAGLAGGLAYWAIAGWSAGFWKPLFRQRETSPLPPRTASHPPEIR
jgi:hypothetical protein